MSKQFVNTLLKEMLDEIDYKTVRTGLDKSRHLVTITVDGLAEAYKDSYNRLAAKDPKFPEPRGWKVFNSSAKAAILFIKQECRAKNSLTEVAATLNDPNKITFYVTRGNHAIFKDIKKVFTTRLSIKLKSEGGSRLTSAYDVKKNNPSMHWGAAARASEIGQINQGIEIHHKNLTTVGIAQLNKGLKFLNSREGFQGFLTSQEVTSLRDIFGQFDAKISWDTVLGDFVLSEDAAIEVDIGSYLINYGGSEPTDWKKIKPVLLKAVNSWAAKQDWWNMPGSKSLREQAEAKIALDIATELAKAKKTTIVLAPKKPNRRKTPVKAVSDPGTRKFKTSNKRARPYTRKKEVQQTPLNISFLVGIMNAKLPAVIAQNMQSPALNNQTGRFASSVRVVDAVRTPQGFPSLGYTYQKSPYQTFEVGYKHGDRDRDPRALIDKSMRQIAAEYAIGRFYTRRV